MSYQDLYLQSIEQPEVFWRKQAELIKWYEFPETWNREVRCVLTKQHALVFCKLLCPPINFLQIIHQKSLHIFLSIQITKDQIKSQ